MKDEQFLMLPPVEARRHANFQGEPDESRLKALYLTRTGIDLDQTMKPTETGEPTSVATPVEERGLGGLAWALIAGGAVLAAWGFLFDVGVNSGSAGLYGIPDRVANVDKIALRHMILDSGLAAFISGWILFGADHVAKALRRS